MFELAVLVYSVMVPVKFLSQHLLSFLEQSDWSYRFSHGPEF
jgi:hypothetical protein